MIKIKKLMVDGLEKDIYTDSKNPHFTFYVESDENEVVVEKAIIECNGWKEEVRDLLNLFYAGPELKPETVYEVKVEVKTNKGDASESVKFETGLLDKPWKASWITDGEYVFEEKGASPKVMVFRRLIEISKKIKRAKLFATAMGIYEVTLNGKKVGNKYFAPGFTSYPTNLQYQIYDLKDELLEKNELIIEVAGGWAVGPFIWSRINKVYADRQALLCELHLTYEDGSEEIIASDEKFDVSLEGPVVDAEWYNGEIYDATIEYSEIKYHKASLEKLKINPKIVCDYGADVVAHQKMTPKLIDDSLEGPKYIYDFGQNFAGVLSLKIKNAKLGQKITIKHAEILVPDTGDLNTDFLKGAKQELVYVCKEGNQEYSPRFTYMGFRYISLEGIQPENIEIKAIVLYSDIEEIGHFESSNPLINRLNENIMWSSRSNFMDIPTDCPQRAERMGWTGDISVFSPVALFNFDISRFLNKWLKDVKAEQGKGGGIPNTIPHHGYGFPETMPVKAIDFWGDCCIYIPWNEYLATGNKQILVDMYPVMKKYYKSCLFWAHLFSLGKNRYIWKSMNMLHFGDWIAPDVPTMGEWQGRHVYTATAALKYNATIIAKVARVLGKTEDIKKYEKYESKVKEAFIAKLTDGNGKTKKEFQTSYVLPLHFDIFEGKNKKEGANNLARIIKDMDYCIGTGFPGTPYILFALADNGHEEDAMKMLLNTRCPSWLYEVKVGGTTIWERWDGLDEDGTCSIGKDGTGGMVSYNHYASGAVADFFYKRLAGIEPIEAGYRKFKVEPLVTKDFSFIKAETRSRFGEICSSWKVEGDKFTIDVKVPVGTRCEVHMPSGEIKELINGKYSFSENIKF